MKKRTKKKAAKKTRARGDIARLTVEVGGDDLEMGFARSPTHCPIARRLKLMGLVDISVGRDSAVFRLEGTSYFKAMLPKKARDLIRHFDLGHQVAPTSFQLIARPF